MAVEAPGQGLVVLVALAEAAQAAAEGGQQAQFLLVELAQGRAAMWCRMPLVGWWKICRPAGALHLRPSGAGRGRRRRSSAGCRDHRFGPGVRPGRCAADADGRPRPGRRRVGDQLPLLLLHAGVIAGIGLGGEQHLVLVVEEARAHLGLQAAGLAGPVLEGGDGGVLVDGGDRIAPVVQALIAPRQRVRPKGMPSPPMPRRASSSWCRAASALPRRSPARRPASAASTRGRNSA